MMLHISLLNGSNALFFHVTGAPVGVIGNLNLWLEVSQNLITLHHYNRESSLGWYRTARRYCLIRFTNECLPFSSLMASDTFRTFLLRSRPPC